jgi:hypothetical protein
MAFASGAGDIDREVPSRGSPTEPTGAWQAVKANSRSRAREGDVIMSGYLNEGVRLPKCSDAAQFPEHR